MELQRYSKRVGLVQVVRQGGRGWTSGICKAMMADRLDLTFLWITTVALWLVEPASVRR